jgi:hypothetical protein
MKRDMDLVRAILLELEKHEHGFAPRSVQIEGYSDEQIGFHIWLMGQADLLRTVDATARGSDSPTALAMNIAWDGYEFLEAARHDTLWQKAKQRVTSAGAGFTLELMTAVLARLAKDAVGL